MILLTVFFAIGLGVCIVGAAYHRGFVFIVGAALALVAMLGALHG